VEVTNYHAIAFDGERMFEGRGGLSPYLTDERGRAL